MFELIFLGLIKFLVVLFCLSVLASIFTIIFGEAWMY